MEVHYNGEWGTVCDDGWDLNDAQVVCRQLGFGTAIAARGKAFYGEGTGETWLDELNCTGIELTINNCSHNGWGNEDCSHREDSGVECLNGNYACTVRMYVQISQICKQFVLLMDQQSTRVEWRCITMIIGEECVLMDGI